MYNHVGTEQRRDATPSTRIHAFTDTWVHISEQQRLFLRPTLAVANTTANTADSSCRVNVPCVTPCSSFVASANIFRCRRVLCGASRRENGRRRGDFKRQAWPSTRWNLRTRRDERVTKENRAKKRRKTRRSNVNKRQKIG